jgi:hypothetical protein
MTQPHRPDRPGFFGGVAIAFVFAVVGAALFASLTPWFTASLAIRVIATALSGSYMLYLLWRSAERTGRIVTVTTWCTSAAVIGSFVPNLPLFLVAHVVLIWLVRSLYFHGSIVTALYDLGLGALALAAAIWAAKNSNSLFLTIWCFFLVHALFVVVPSGTPKSATADDGDNQSFQRARRSADAALRRLVDNI